MNYCKNCQRIAADDEKFCIVCGESILGETEIKVEPVQEILHEPVKEDLHEPVQVSVHMKPPEVPPIMVERQAAVAEKRIPITTTIDEEEPIGLIKKIALITLAVFIAPFGLITGLIMMSSSEQYKREYGQIIVIVSVVVFVALTVCCCALAVIGTLAYS